MVSRIATANGVWNPWRELARLQNEMGRMFQESPITNSFVDGPAFNIWKYDGGLLATAEIPGLNPSELDISVVGDTVTISGQRVVEEQPEGARVQRRERAGGKFTRVLKLPHRVDATRASATYERGVLKVDLPASEEEKPHQISVKSGQ